MANEPGQRPTDGPWTIGRLLDWTAGFLKDKGSESPRLDAEVLLAHTLECRRIMLYTRFDEIAGEEVRAKFKVLIRQRVEGCPVAYLVGKKEFFSLDFEVGPAVLIPRPDTETLVGECLKLAKTIPAALILDMGTGSGAIAVAVAKQKVDAQLTASDVSPDAITMAKRNAEKHGLHSRIRFLEGDLFTSLDSEERFDFILSNPPYIAGEEWDRLPIGVRQYEPKIALDGGAQGLEVVARLVEQAGPYIKPGGWLMLEIGSPQENDVRRLIEKQSDFSLKPTIRDYSGHPRVLVAQWRK